METANKHIYDNMISTHHCVTSNNIPQGANILKIPYIDDVAAL